MNADNNPDTPFAALERMRDVYFLPGPTIFCRTEVEDEGASTVDPTSVNQHLKFFIIPSGLPCGAVDVPTGLVVVKHERRL
jgi:hypothetical protein